MTDTSITAINTVSGGVEVPYFDRFREKKAVTKGLGINCTVYPLK